MSRYIDTLSIDNDMYGMLVKWAEYEQEQWECEVITFQLVSNSFILQEKNMTRAEAEKLNKSLDENSGLGRWQEKGENNYPDAEFELPY